MKYKRLKDSILYDGSQIEPMWALKNFNIKGSSLITWIGPMNIKKDEIIDYEDVGLEIKSQKMLHFMVEHFDCQPADLRLCYHRQRLLVTMVKDILEELGLPIKRNGDDLFINQGKLSVSIATCSASSMKIHLGINLTREGTPEGIATAGLKDWIKGLDNETAYRIAEKVFEAYYMELNSIEEDISKTRVF
ncbi:MAG: DUF366 family protein [Methanobacteriaceae archaeon]